MHTTWGIATGKWRREMQAAKTPAGTQRLRLYYVGRFATHVGINPAAVTRDDLIDWFAPMAWAPNTLKSARSSLRAFYLWAEEEGIVAASPAARLPSISTPRGEPRPASDEAIEDALSAASRRERLMILLGAVGGLRREEITVVHRDDLDGRRLYVHGKGRKTRVINVPTEIARELRLACRDNGWAFPSTHGGHLTPGHVGVLISRCLPDGITPHQLRHAAADYLFNVEELDLLEIRDFLGHSDVATTQIYTPNRRDRTGQALERAARRFDAA